MIVLVVSIHKKIVLDFLIVIKRDHMKNEERAEKLRCFNGQK